MKIHVEWLGQARAAAGCEEEVVECDTGTTIAQVLTKFAEKHGGALRGILLSESGKLHPSVMVFVNGEQVSPGQAATLVDGDELTVMPPISGG